MWQLVVERGESLMQGLTTLNYQLPSNGGDMLTATLTATRPTSRSSTHIQVGID